MLPSLKHKSKMLHFLLQFLKVIAELTVEPAIAAMHGPHSLVRIGTGCAGRA